MMPRSPQGAKIRILLCDGHRLFCEGLRTILEMEPDFEVVGEAANGEEGVSLTQRLRPDLVILDVRTPRMDGGEATRRIRATGHTQVVILSTYEDDECILEALEADAVAYLLKDFPPEELVKALRTIHHSGGVLIPPTIAAKVADELHTEPRPDAGASLRDPFSQSEEDILRLVAQSRSNQEIADELGLAEGSVKNSLSRIYAKLAARDRTQAALWAVATAWAQRDPSARTETL